MSGATVIVGCVDGTLPASDRAAVSAALRLFGEAVGACAPSGHEPALRYALGAGAVEAEDPDTPVILLGAGGGEALAGKLAAARDAALVFDVLEVQRDEETLAVTSDAGRGARLVFTVVPPAVLVFSDDAPGRRYVSRHRQARAKVTPRRAKTEPGESWEPVRLRARAANLAEKTAGSATARLLDAFGLSSAPAGADTHVIAADPRRCAEHLLRYLAHHRFVDRPAPAPPAETPQPLQPAKPTQAVTMTQLPPRVARRPRRLGDTCPPRRGPVPLSQPTEIQP